MRGVLVHHRRSIFSLAVPLASAAFIAAGCASPTEQLATGDLTTTRPVFAHEKPAAAPPAQVAGQYSLAYPTGDRATSVLLVEQEGAAEVRLNREYNYTLRVSNLTNQTLRKVVLQSANAKALHVIQASATTRPAEDGQVIYDVGDLAPKESRAIQVTGIPEREGAIDAAYTIAYIPPTFNTSLSVVNPVMKVTARGPADAEVCQDIVYTYSVANVGTGVARGVVLIAKLPDGLTTTTGHADVSENAGDVAAGESHDVSIRLRAAGPGKIAVAAAATSDGDVVLAEVLHTKVSAPALAVKVQGAAQDYARKKTVFHVTVTNTGDAPARQAFLNLATSEIGQILAVDRGQSVEGAVGQSAAQQLGQHESLGTIDPGASRTLDVTVQGNTGGNLTLTAAAEATCAKRVSEAAQIKILTVASLLLEAADESDPVRVGDTVVYNIKVTNQGSGPDANIRVTAILPDEEQLVSATGATDGSGTGQTITFAPVAALAPRESVTWKVVAKALHAADVQFKVIATSDAMHASAQKTEPTKLY